MIKTRDGGKCWRCHEAIGFFEPTQQEWIEANSLQQLKITPRWLHVDEPGAYSLCKVNGFHPGPGTSTASASPQSALIRNVVIASAVVLVVFVFLIFSFATYG
ncbi:MAG: hypothetical protein AB7H92_18740 [Microbacteriaceae bacterium]